MKDLVLVGKPVHLKSLIMGIFLAFSAFLLFGITGLLLVYAQTSGTSLPEGADLGLRMLAAGTAVLGFLLLPGTVLNFRRLLHKPDIQFQLPIPNNRILFPILIIAWLFCLLIGQLSTENPRISAFLIPIVNVFAVGIPVLFYIRISLNGLRFPNARTGWSVFGSALLIPPALAFIFEGLAVGLLLLVFVLLAKFQPGLQDKLKIILEFIQSGKDDNGQIMRLIESVLFKPGFVFSTLGIFSIIVPMVEESFKVVLILPFLNRIRAPIDGYILGILCGSAFALVENIGFSSSGSADWTLSVMARTTSALPHIFNSGVLGWALVSAWKNQGYGKLAISFLSVILLHGFWNAVSLGLALNSLSSNLINIPIYLQFDYPWIAAWITLTIGVFGGLIFNNHQMQKILANTAD